MKKISLHTIVRDLRNPHDWKFSGSDIYEQEYISTCWDKGKITRRSIEIEWTNGLGFWKDLEIRVDQTSLNAGLKKRKLIQSIKFLVRDKMISAAGFENEDSANQYLALALSNNPNIFSDMGEKVLRPFKKSFAEYTYREIGHKKNTIGWRENHAYIVFPNNIVIEGSRALRKALKKFEKHEPGQVFQRKKP